MNDDTARRERAEKWADESFRLHRTIIPADLANAYLAGAREEAAIWSDASQCGHPDPCTLGALCPYCEIGRRNAEIAKLRKTVRVLTSGDATHRNCSADECMVAAVKGSGVVKRAQEEES